MKRCKWCGEPMAEELVGQTRYCCDKCKINANRFNAMLNRNPGLPHEIEAQEYAWHYLFWYMNKAEPNMLLKETLGLPEWELMMDLIEAFNYRRASPNKERLIQLGSIGEKLLAIPADAHWNEVLENTRARISWYVNKGMRELSRKPEMLIPSKPEKDENQTRKKRR